MNKREHRKRLLEINEQQLLLNKAASQRNEQRFELDLVLAELQKSRLEHEIKMVQSTTEKLKAEMTNMYKACVKEAKKQMELTDAS